MQKKVILAIVRIVSLFVIISFGFITIVATGGGGGGGDTPTDSGEWQEYSGNWESPQYVVEGWSTDKFALDGNITANGEFEGTFDLYFRGSCLIPGDFFCLSYTFLRFNVAVPATGFFNFTTYRGELTIDSVTTGFDIISLSSNKIKIQLDDTLECSDFIDDCNGVSEFDIAVLEK